MRSARKKGLNVKYTVFVGYSDSTEKFNKLVNENRHWGYKVLGVNLEKNTNLNNLINLTNDVMKEENQKRIEKGLCTRCGKRNADSGYKTCGICRAKDGEKRRIRNYKSEKRSDRTKRGLCYFCDNPVEEGFKVCKKHRKMNIEKSRSDKAKGIRKQLVEQGILY